MFDPRDPDAASLQTLPWELLRQPGTPDFLALDRRRSIVRYPLIPRPVEAAPKHPTKLRLLCVMANNRYLPGLDLERELQVLRRVVDKYSGVEIKLLRSPTLEAVRQTLIERECHVFHFIGHSDFTESEGGVLFFERPDGSPDPIRGKDLASKLLAVPSLRLAVLNACNGARASHEDTFAGTAQVLVQHGVPAVIAMQSEVMDETACGFAEKFYRGLAAGLPVDACVGEVRRALAAERNPEWGTPVLYLRATDGRLFAFEEGDKFD